MNYDSPETYLRSFSSSSSYSNINGLEDLEQVNVNYEKLPNKPGIGEIMLRKNNNKKHFMFKDEVRNYIQTIKNKKKDKKNITIKDKKQKKKNKKEKRKDKKNKQQKKNKQKKNKQKNKQKKNKQPKNKTIKKKSKKSKNKTRKNKR